MSDWTQDLPARVSLQVGQRWSAPLRSGAGGGYLWQVDGKSEVARCEIVVGALPPPGDPPNAVLAPVTLVVVGTTPGSARFSLRLARPFGGGEVLAQTQIEVDVTA